MARTARKKISVYDEGIQVLDDVDELNYEGAGVSSAATGRRATETIPGYTSPFTYPFAYIPTSPVKASSLGPELLTDPGFEIWTSASQLTSWTTQVAAGSPTLTRVTTPVQAGTYAAQITGDGNNPDLLALESNVMSGTPGDTIVFSGYQTENSMAGAGFGSAYFLDAAFASATEIYNFDTNLWETLGGGGVWATIFGAVDPGVYLPQIAPSATYTQVTDTLPVPASGSFVCMALGVPYMGGGAFTQFIDTYSVKIQTTASAVTLYDLRNDTVFANLDASDTFVKFGIGVVDGLKINGVGAWTTNFPTFNLSSKEVRVATATLSSSAVTLAQLQAGYQPLDADLTAIAAITTNGLIKRTGAGTWAGAQSVGLTSEVTGVLPVANGGTGTAVQFTPGSMVFVGSGGVYQQDNAGVFYDSTNKSLWIGGGVTPQAYDKLMIRGSDVTGNGIRIYLQNTNNTSSSYAAYTMYAGTDGSGGTFFGSRASYTSFGIVNGITFRAGLSTQDIGFAVGNNVLGTGLGPQLFLSGTTGNIGIGTLTTTGGKVTIDATPGAPNLVALKILQSTGSSYGLEVTSLGYSGIKFNAGTGYDPFFHFMVNNTIKADFFFNDAAQAFYFRNVVNGPLYLATNNTIRQTILGNGNAGFQITPTAKVHIAAGTATANTAPLKFTSGTSLTTAEAGAMEFTTDDFFLTITTGAARKGIVLDDGTRLTSGKIPIATTNGRLIDGETPLSGTKVYYVSDTNGGPVDRKLTFINGILTAET